jgi:type III restriction enzyme
MKFQFQSNLQYQLDAILSVAMLFVGQSKISPKNTILADGVCANTLNISKTKLFENRDQIILKNKINLSESILEGDFTIEMETGTGKTYVYIRTVFELHKLYGLHKFIIIVPSVAVRAGVLKTLEITKSHLNELYSSNATVVEYDRKNIAKLKNGFCYNNGLSILVTTAAAFNSENNIINQERDSTGGEKLIDLIGQTNPIIIMDEPQEGMDAEQTAKYISKFNPLIKLRYSATHKIVKNLIYQLNSIDAYNQNLVKKIEILSVFESGTESNLTLELQDIITTKGNPEAKMLLAVRQSDGTFKNKTIAIKNKDVLQEKTNNPVYFGWVVEKVMFEGVFKTRIGLIKFSNGKIFKVGEKHGVDTIAIFRSQIKYAIQNHFQKKQILVPKYIKPICLFFVDKVSNYVDNEGLIRKLFVEEYTKLYNSHNAKNPENIDKVHSGYFAKTSNGDFTDNESSMKKNKEIYDLILRDKEKLLSLEEPLEFIFSHSALGVGWDNPNVFTICTLKETVSTNRKRQEIGRGLRICVNTDGQRVYDDPATPEGQETNILTVIPNQSYESFAATYQKELEEDTKITNTPNILRDKKQIPTTVNIKQELLGSKVFQDLWSRINQKTTFCVDLDETKLIQNSITELNNIVTTRPTLSITMKRVVGLDRENLLQGQYIGETQEDAKFDTPPINLINEIISKTSLSHKTASSILSGISSQARAYLIQNPLEYISIAIGKIEFVINELMVGSISYAKTDKTIDIGIFESIVTYKPTAVFTKSLYDNMGYDSDIEKNFATELDKSGKVKVFVKLPAKYKIDTPIGSYSPDFAFVVENTDLDTNKSTFHFVVETKGTHNIQDLKPSEQIKIQCAIKHFQALGLEPLKNAKYLAPIKDKAHFNQEVKKDTDYSQATLF